jgi:hypothetical protein
LSHVRIGDIKLSIYHLILWRLSIMGDDEEDAGMEIDTDYDSGPAEEQGNAGEDTADDASEGYGDDKN